MKKNKKTTAAIITCTILTFISAILQAQTMHIQKAENITFKASDGLAVNADLYMAHEKSAPFIILFHQASWSRGEYISIAPELNKMGFNCMAVDQRSGGKVNDIVNKTHEAALILQKNTGYTDAFPDLEAALLYIIENTNPENLIVWGSSYSSSLVFPLAEKYKDKIDGILSFSPGEYFKLDNKSIKDYAKNIDCPVFITSSKAEHKNWKEIFESLKSEEKIFFLPDFAGYHGSRALWPQHSGNEKYWEAVKGFLKKYLSK